MAVDKRVKTGGSYYKGFELIIGTTAGAHVLDMLPTGAIQAGAVCINSLSITPDQYGVGDTMEVSHMNSGTTKTLFILAENIYNLGAGLSVSFDFPAFESMASGEPLRLTYTKSDVQTPVTVHTIVEYAGWLKTT